MSCGPQWAPLWLLPPSTAFHPALGHIFPHPPMCTAQPQGKVKAVSTENWSFQGVGGDHRGGDDCQHCHFQPLSERYSPEAQLILPTLGQLTPSQPVSLSTTGLRSPASGFSAARKTGRARRRQQPYWEPRLRVTGPPSPSHQPRPWASPRSHPLTYPGWPGLPGWGRRGH